MAETWIPVLVNLTPEQTEVLRKITYETRISRNEIIRAAVDEWLAKREDNRNVIL
jgi:hypothetical protein